MEDHLGRGSRGVSSCCAHEKRSMGQSRRGREGGAPFPLARRRHLSQTWSITGWDGHKLWGSVCVCVTPGRVQRAREKWKRRRVPLPRCTRYHQCDDILSIIILLLWDDLSVFSVALFLLSPILETQEERREKMGDMVAHTQHVFLLVCV